MAIDLRIASLRACRWLTRVSLASLLICVYAMQAALASPNNWLTAASGDWSDGTKWSLGSPPVSADDASIPFAAINVTFNTNSTLNSLATSANLQILGGTLSGSQLNSATPVTVGGGTLSLNGGGLSNLTLAAGAGAITIAANGGNSFNSVVISHDVSVDVNGYVQVFNSNALNSTIALAGGSNGIQLRDGNALLTVSATGLIHGSGSVFQTFGGSTLAVNGQVTADQATKTLALATSNIIGSGSLAAANGGTLSIGGLLNGTGLSVNVDNTPGSLVMVDGGGLSGTLASTTGSGLSFSGNGNNIISSAAINGDLTFNGTAYAQVFNSNTLAGTIHMAGTSDGIQLRDGNAVLNVGAAGAIRGYGQIFQTFGGATVANSGTISADTAATTLALNSSNISGGGIFEAKNGGVLSIGGLLNGSNAVVHVDADPNSAVVVNGGGLTGTFAASTGSGISFNGNGNNLINGATIAADLTFSGAAYAQVFNTNALTGTIHMAGASNGIQLRDGNAVLTVNSAGAIRGFGTIFQTFGGANLANNGIISADLATKTLALNVSNISGSGTFEGKNGGVLSIGGILNGSSAIVQVDGNPASAVQVNGGGLKGSFAASTGTGISFSGNASNTIDSATIAADLTFSGNAFAQVFNANSESGTIHMAGTGNGIQLRDGNATLTISSAGAVRGFGTIFQTFVGANLGNNGVISADSAGQTLALNPSNIGGSGIFEAKNGGVLSIGGLLNGNGAVAHVDSDPASAVLVNGGGLTGTFGASTGTGISFSANGNNLINGATINGDLTFNGNAYAQVFNSNSVGGTVHMAGTSNGIQLRDGNAVLTISATGKLQGFGTVFETFGGSQLVNNGTIAADSIGHTLALNNSVITNNANISVLAAMSVGGSMTQHAGHTTVDGALSLAQTFVIDDGLLSGVGTITGNVTNAGGHVGPGDSTGLLTITGNYSQGIDGAFDVELGGTSAGSFDQLNVSGSASLAGRIYVDLLNGFAPSVGQQFDVILRGSGSGSFGSLQTNTPGLAYTVDYQPTKVIVTITSVPEPSAVILAGAAGMVLLLMRRASRNRSLGVREL